MISKDKVLGAFIGAAIGDAMGGPVECQHAARIKKHYGPVISLLPYQKPPGLMDLHPGYALQSDPGSITDDTFIRMDFAQFFLDHSEPYTPEMLASWLLENVNFDYWWLPAVKALKRIQAGEVSVSESGMSHMQGGGNGWWTPIGILYAGHPEKAAKITKELSCIWKAPLEQDLNSSIQAGLAEALKDDADVNSVLEAMLAACGPLATTLLERAIDIGKNARNFDHFIQEVYNHLLFDEAPTSADGELPKSVKPVEYAEEKYTSVLLAEQVSIEVASLVFSRGDFMAIPYTVMIGRDCDSTATTVGSWVGALHGEQGLPREWVQQVCEINLKHIDIRGMGEDLYAKMISL